MIINYCGFSYLPHSGTSSALVDSRNKNFYHIPCLLSLMGLSHINLHGIHKILSHQHFLSLMHIGAGSKLVVRQKGPGIEIGKALWDGGKTDWERIQEWGWHKLALEIVSTCWREANKLNPNDHDETTRSSGSDLIKAWDFPLNTIQAHLLPRSHRVVWLSTGCRTSKGIHGKWGHNPRECRISSTRKESISIAIWFPKQSG